MPSISTGIRRFCPRVKKSKPDSVFVLQAITALPFSIPVATVSQIISLTRPCGRALQEAGCPNRLWSKVSILTRPCGRALRTGADCDSIDMSFQSSPALAGGRYFIEALLAFCIASFNPHPPLRAGATILDIYHRYKHQSFNPHPPLRAGATAFMGSPCHYRPVSILTRPCGRALRYSRTHLPNI